jgi:hypothetical protein
LEIGNFLLLQIDKVLDFLFVFGRIFQLLQSLFITHVFLFNLVLHNLHFVFEFFPLTLSTQRLVNILILWRIVAFLGLIDQTGRIW